MDAELKRFKTDIDLRHFAESLGFAFNPRESWRGSAVMERGQQDKIIITLDGDGHHVYFSVKQDHSGSIIDLAKHYVNSNLGHVRRSLRQWRGGGAQCPTTLPLPRLEKTPKDLVRVAREWHSAKPYASHEWLERERAIPPALLHTPRFEGTLRIDSYGNVLFAHSDAEGHLCGFERKNRGFAGFASGGSKALGRSNDVEADTKVVFAEAFIDLLSYAALFPEASTRYRSFAGGLNPSQPDLIRADISSLPPGSVVVAATDGDEAGERFAQSIADLSAGYEFHVHRPATGDWNDVLRASVLPTAPHIVP